MEHLQEKTGALSPLKKFRFQLREIIKPNHLPDYVLSLDDKDVVTFTNRHSLMLKHISAQGTLPGLEDIPTIHAETLRRGAELVEKSGTGWEYRAIREQFTGQLIGGFTPENVDAAFIGFVKKKVATRP